MRIAVLHDTHAEPGTEDVVEQLRVLWPDATLRTASSADVAQAASGARRTARARAAILRLVDRGDGRYARLLRRPSAVVPPVDLSGFDLVLTVHRTFAQRVHPPAGVPVVSYGYSPARWIWDPRARGEEGPGRVWRRALDAQAVRQQCPDRAAAACPDVLVAPSRAVAERIRVWWGREAEVVPPPVDVGWYTPVAPGSREDFFLYAGRLVPSKCPEIAVAAARAAGVRLVVAGEGRSRPALERIAGRRAEFLGWVGPCELRELYRTCAGVVVPGEEDFGKVAVEAQACGTPVLALGAGGSLDTVVDGLTGRLWQPLRDGTPVGSLAHEMRRFDPGAYDSRQLRRHAEGFAPERFRRDLHVVVGQVLSRAESAAGARHAAHRSWRPVTCGEAARCVR